MKKKVLLCLSLLGASAGLLSAQVEKGMPRQGTYPALTTEMSTPMYTPPGSNFVWDNASSTRKGVQLFGGTITDRVERPHIVRLFSKKPYEIERLAAIAPNDPLKHTFLHCGAYIGDRYIGYVVTLYTYGMQYLPNRFVQVNTLTGEIESLIEYNYQSEEYKQWPTLYEMTYDYKRNKCWGVGRSTRTDRAASAIYEVNPQTGKFTFVKDLDFYAWGAACDYDGNFWVSVGQPDKEDKYYIGSYIQRLDPDKQFSVVADSRKDIKREGNAIIPYFSHTMDFDHTTGDLYWLATEMSGNQYIHQIDPATGATTTSPMIGMGDNVGGLYIPFEKADKREAAARVNELNAQHDASDYKKAKLTWKNPTTTWNRQSLASLAKITIARDTRDNIVATLSSNVNTGAAMTWVDDNPAQGVHTYYVTPYRVDGEKGVLDSIRCYTGLDIPAAVGNISAQKASNASIQISWSAPTIGAHEGWINSSDVSYTVVRMPDSKTIATDMKETTLTDNSLQEVKGYYYIITPKNSLGEGVAAESKKVIAGLDYGLPFKSDFSTQEDADRWTIIDNNQDGIRFTFSGGGSEAFSRMALYPAGMDKASDDWLLSPNLSLKAGSRYEITVKPQIELANSIHSFSITIGKGATVEAQKVVASFEDYTVSTPSEVKTEIVTTDVAENGIYNVGVHCTSVAGFDSRDIFSVQEVSIREIFKKDLAVADFSLSELINQKDNKVIVKVLNDGSEDQSSYKVKLLQIDGEKATVVAETSEVPAIKAGESAECTLTFKPTQEGKMILAAEVSLEGDADASDNRSQSVEVNILPAGTVSWTHLLTGESISHETTLPMSFMSKYSVGQTTYYAEEIKVNENAPILRMAYDYIEGVATNDVDVKIYMANVDQKTLNGLTLEQACMKPANMTLVYEGQIAVKEGANRMEFNLQTPFEYQAGKHLCIQVWKDGRTENPFPAQFVTYDKAAGEVLRSVRYQHSKDQFNPSAPTPTATMLLDWVPQLRLAIKTKSGVQDVVVGTAITYNSATKMLQLGDFNAQAVRVYDLAGQLLQQKALANGTDKVALDLLPGAYIVSVEGTDGSVANIKISVNQ